MIKFKGLSSKDQVQRYYVKSDGITRGDYYQEGEEQAGRWFGFGADRLHLTGFVDRKQFNALAENINPETGQQLTLRNNATQSPDSG